jgi:hypothetical protein
MVYRFVTVGLPAGITAGVGALVMQPLQKWDIGITDCTRLVVPYPDPLLEQVESSGNHLTINKSAFPSCQPLH